MKTKRRISVPAGAYIIMLLAMFLIPFVSSSGYSFVRNTIFELGAQLAPNAWIINSIIVFLALSIIIEGWSYYDCFSFHRILLVLSGISLALTALFNHAPANPDLEYNITEAGFNSYFACTSVFSFIILSLATAFILERQADRRLALITGLSVLVLSILTSEYEEFAGIWNRLQFIISPGWLIYIFETREI